MSFHVASTFCSNSPSSHYDSSSCNPHQYANMTTKSIFGSIKNKLTSNKRASVSYSTNNPYRSNDMPYQPSANPAQFTTEAPPAYSSDHKTQAPTPSSPPPDSPFAFLSTFDTIFLIDDSASMSGSRWHETALALESITPICLAHDSDGIDIYFLNAPPSTGYRNITSAAVVREIFSSVRPRGATPTGVRLHSILGPYMRNYAAWARDSKDGESGRPKPVNLIVVTDGEASDDVESPLISAASKLDELDAPAWQVGVQFFQVGREEGARRQLERLDDELAAIAEKRLRDIVDTVPFRKGGEGALTGEGILKVVLGAVNRRLDRKVEGLHA